MLCGDAQTMLCSFPLGCKRGFWMLGYGRAAKAPARPPPACRRPLMLLSEAGSSGRGAEMGFGSAARITVPIEEAGVPRDAPEWGKSVLGSNRDS